MDALPKLRAAMGKQDGEGSGRKWTRDKGEHAPGIELYLDGRYFAVTERHLPDTPAELRPVPVDTLLALIREAETRFGKPQPKDNSTSGNGADKSRSAAAFRKGAALRRQGRTFEEMCAALLADPETAEWCKEKGEANGQRELRRIWDKAAPQGWLNHCQRNSEGNPRSNLANAIWHSGNRRSCATCSHMTRCCERR